MIYFARNLIRAAFTRLKNLHGLYGARLFLIFQALLIGVVFVCFLNKSLNAAISAALAGGVCALPNAFFAYRFFKRNGAQQVKTIVSCFYKCESLKLMISATLFAGVFAWRGVVPEVFFCVYLLFLLTHLFAPWFFGLSSNKMKVFYFKSSGLNDI